MSNQIFDILQNVLTDQVMDQLNVQVGNPQREKTALATNSIINTLIGALANNTTKAKEERQLDEVLERDHAGGGLLDNLLGVLTGQVEANNRATDGLGILMHLLGGRSREAVDMVSNLSGLDRNKVSRLMIMLAPIVLAAVAKAKKQAPAPQQQTRRGGGGLMDLLNQTVQNQRQNSNNPTMDIAKRFLDKDGDGKIQEEVAQIGMKILGNLFKKR